MLIVLPLPTLSDLSTSQGTVLLMFTTLSSIAQHTLYASVSQIFNIPMVLHRNAYQHSLSDNIFDFSVQKF